MALDPFVMGPASSGPMRLNEQNAPAMFHPALSMVGWLQPGTDKPGSLTFFDIPSASRRPPAPFGTGLVHELAAPSILSSFDVSRRSCPGSDRGNPRNSQLISGTMRSWQRNNGRGRTGTLIFCD